MLNKSNDGSQAWLCDDSDKCDSHGVDAYRSAACHRHEVVPDDRVVEDSIGDDDNARELCFPSRAYSCQTT